MPSIGDRRSGWYQRGTISPNMQTPAACKMKASQCDRRGRSTARRMVEAFHKSRSPRQGYPRQVPLTVTKATRLHNAHPAWPVEQLYLGPRLSCRYLKNRPVDGESMSGEAITTRVPRPACCHTQIVEFGRQLELRSPRFFRGQGCAAAFLGLWLIGWSAGCSTLLTRVRADPSLFHIVFAIPFITAWFAASGALIGILFGRHRLAIDPQGLDYRFRAIVPLRRRHVPLAELKRAVSAIAKLQSESDQAHLCVRIETTGKPVDFGRSLRPEELRWLIQRINDHLDSLRPQQRFQRDSTSAEAAEVAGPEPLRTTYGAEVLTVASRLVTPPSDCRFALEDFDELRFEWVGRWNLAALAGTTFINLFWNGIVCVFVLVLIRDFQWFLFFFLIPFEVIGLAMFVAWIFALAAPACRERWCFGWEEIQHRRSLFGVGWTSRYRAEPLSRIELEKRPAAPGATANPGMIDLADHDGDYLLSFISRDERIAFQIEGLTEGEARWIADQVLRAHAEWFRSPRQI